MLRHLPSTLRTTFGLAFAFVLTLLAACGGGDSRGTTSGVVTTLAGNGTEGFVDGAGGPSGRAELASPCGATVDAAGNVYVADVGNNRIRKVDRSGNTTTLAGNGTAGFFDGTGGPSGTTEFAAPNGVATDTAGNVYVADTANNRVRKIDPSGHTTTLAGNGKPGFFDGTGGPCGSAEFAAPWEVAIDAAGNVYVADAENHRIRKIAPSGDTTTLTGNGALGFFDGTGGPSGTTELMYPYGVTVDALGNVYVSDAGNNRIRKVDPSGNTTTLAGNGVAGFVDGTGGPSGTTEFADPQGVAVDAAGNLYVAELDNNRIRKVEPSGKTTTLAGNGVAGFVDGPSGTAEFFNPVGVTVDTMGNVYVGDAGNSRIRKIVP